MHVRRRCCVCYIITLHLTVLCSKILTNGEINSMGNKMITLASVTSLLSPWCLSFFFTPPPTLLVRLDPCHSSPLPFLSIDGPSNDRFFLPTWLNGWVANRHVSYLLSCARSGGVSADRHHGAEMQAQSNSVGHVSQGGPSEETPSYNVGNASSILSSSSLSPTVQGTHEVRKHNIF
jgi:hypothetical protein